MTDTPDLTIIRAAADAPATTPLVARLQSMLLQLLPLHEAALSGAAPAPSADDEPSREEINAYRNAVDTARRYGCGHDENRCIAEGLKAARRARQ